MSARIRSALAAGVATLGVAAAAAGPASAAVSKCQAQNVTLGTKESPNLQALIDAAGAGNTIQVKGICVGNYTIAKSLTVFGKPTKEVPAPTLDGNATGSVVTISGEPAPTVAIRDLTTTNGSAQIGAGIYNRGATLSLTDVVVRNNVGTGTVQDPRSFGGGVFSLGTLTIGGSSVFRDNRAAFGGGFYVTGEATLNDSVSITGNSAGDGGGIYVGLFALLTLNDSSSVTNNSAQFGGGGITCSLNATVTGAVVGVGGNVYDNTPTDITTCP